jgi:hypothetical protein
VKIRKTCLPSILGISAEGVKEHEVQRAGGSRQREDCRFEIFDCRFSAGHAPAASLGHYAALSFVVIGRRRNCGLQIQLDLVLDIERQKLMEIPIHNN